MSDKISMGMFSGVQYSHIQAGKIVKIFDASAGPGSKNVQPKVCSCVNPYWVFGKRRICNAISRRRNLGEDDGGAVTVGGAYRHRTKWPKSADPSGQSTFRDTRIQTMMSETSLSGVGGRARKVAAGAMAKDMSSSSSSSGREEYTGPAGEHKAKQVEATQLIARLVEAGSDAYSIAKENIDSLSEEFFYVGATYLQMAQKEGEVETAGRLKMAMQAAMDAKQLTLREEIQLLNNLLRCDTVGDVRKWLSRDGAVEKLKMNDMYFFSLLKTMQQDVEKQPESQQKYMLKSKLDMIRSESAARANIVL